MLRSSSSSSIGVDISIINGRRQLDGLEGIGGRRSGVEIPDRRGSRRSRAASTKRGCGRRRHPDVLRVRVVSQIFDRRFVGSVVDAHEDRVDRICRDAALPLNRITGANAAVSRYGGSTARDVVAGRIRAARPADAGLVS